MRAFTDAFVISNEPELELDDGANGPDNYPDDDCFERDDGGKCDTPIRARPTVPDPMLSTSPDSRSRLIAPPILPVASPVLQPRLRELHEEDPVSTQILSTKLG